MIRGEVYKGSWIYFINNCKNLFYYNHMELFIICLQGKHLSVTHSTNQKTTCNIQKSFYHQNNK
jgi:hypothetical protein